MVCHSDEKPLDIGIRLYCLLPMQFLLETVIETKLSFPGSKPHFRLSRTVCVLVLRPLL